MGLFDSFLIVGDGNELEFISHDMLSVYAKKTFHIDNEINALSAIKEKGVPDILMYTLTASSYDGVSFLHQMSSLPGSCNILLFTDINDVDLTNAIIDMISLESNHFCFILKTPVTNADFFGILNSLKSFKERSNQSNLSADEMKWGLVNISSPSEIELQKAFSQKQFKPYFQPKICSKSGVANGVEALVRWEHPIYGVCEPSFFLNEIKRLGLQSKLALQVLEQSLFYINEWRERGRELKISVNLSSKQLVDPHFMDKVFYLLNHYAIPSYLLCIEITEEDYCTDLPGLLAAAAKLRLYGISLSIDDFGTGFSSLLQLVQNPVNELKIDRYFVSKMHEARYLTAIQASLFLAKKLSLHSVAEGVECEHQVSELRRMGCDSFQGFYYSPALPENELWNWWDYQCR